VEQVLELGPDAGFDLLLLFDHLAQHTVAQQPAFATSARARRCAVRLRAMRMPSSSSV
jgi:hypothetical protein